MKVLKSLAIGLLLAGASSANAQVFPEGTTFGTATVTAEYCVTLDPSSPVQEWYEMDISAFGFTNLAEAQNAFLMRSNNLISYNVVDLAEQKAYARVHVDRTPAPEDIVWWNDYLSTLCPTD